MNISREWLSEYVDFSELNTHDFSELITTRVAEVEACYKIGAPLKYALAAEVKSLVPHASKDNLTIVSLNTGDRIYQVVSGAKKLKVGDNVAFIPPGGKLKKIGKSSSDERLIENLIDIVEREIAGVKSEGAIVSEAELGLSLFHDDILNLNEFELKPGQKLCDFIHGEDDILEIDNKSLTHRPDLWSHLGFAREISAILKKPLKLNLDRYSDAYGNKSEEFKDLFLDKPKSPYSCNIESGTQASRFTCLNIQGLKNGKSPLWLRRRLFTVGVTLRNLLVDTSNYVLFDVGQPNHAFDQRSVRSKELEARFAKQGESFTSLDGVDRILSTDDVVIADSVGPLDLAGVIGGKGFSVEDDTADILLVTSCFDPVRIRKTCRKNQVRTPSSNLYEKSLSPYQVPLAPLRFIDVLKRAGQNPQIPYSASDCFPDKPERLKINYSPEYIRERLAGKPDTDEEIKDIVQRLGFAFEKNDVLVPYFRATKDISIIEDLVEEVGRTIGYENIPTSPPQILSTGSKRAIIQSSEKQIRTILSAQGYTEIYNYTFTSKELSEKLGYDMSTSIEVLNPVDKNLKVTQSSLVPNLVDAAVRNLKNVKNIAGFEIGRSYHNVSEGQSGADPADPISFYDSVIRERRLVGLFLTGQKSEKVTFSDPALSSGQTFYSLRESVSRLCIELVGQTPDFVALKSDQSSYSLAEDYQKTKRWMHPGRSAAIWVGGICLGIIAELKPSMVSLISGLNLGDRVVVAELDFEALLSTLKKPIQFKEFSKFPDSFFEVSLVVEQRSYFKDIVEKVKSNLTSKKFLKEVKPVSVFEGAPIPGGFKSLSLQFTFSKDEETISSEELLTLREDVIKASSLSGYSLRQ